MNTKKDRSKLQQIQANRRYFHRSINGILRKLKNISFNPDFKTKKEIELILRAKTILNEISSEYLDTNKQFGLKVPEYRCFCGKGARYLKDDSPLCYHHLNKEILSDFAQNQYKYAYDLKVILNAYKSTENHEAILKKDLKIIRYISVDNKVYGAYLKDSNDIKWLYLEIKGNRFYYKFDSNDYISIFNIDTHYKVPNILGISIINNFIPKNKYLDNLLKKLTK